MANKKFYVDIDLQNNKLDNATIGANSSINSLAGSFQYNSGTGRLQYRDSSTTQDVANLNDIVGYLNFKGGYNATTNVPDLVTPTAGSVREGDFYVVTTAGTFFTEEVAIGDSLIAKVDNPSALTDWVRVQSNVTLATESVAGITYLANATQVATGTETGAYAVNPATLQGKIDAQSRVFTLTWTGSAGAYTSVLTVPAGFATDGVVASFVDGSGNAADFAYTIDTPTQITVKANTNPTGIKATFVRGKA
jgi:hypothetical protein